MLIYESQAVELPPAKFGDARCHHVLHARSCGLSRRIMRSVQMIQCNPHPAQHPANSRAESRYKQ